MRVVIAGAGNVGQFIAADLLPGGHHVIMLERDPVIVDTARAGALAKAEWFTVDACEVLSLEFAGLRHADVVVAATGDDEDLSLIHI